MSYCLYSQSVSSLIYYWKEIKTILNLRSIHAAKHIDELESKINFFPGRRGEEHISSSTARILDW